MPKRILIIDDDLALCELLQSFLLRYDYDVATAQHPDQGISLLHQYKPDLIILDVMLPGRDGFAVLQELRREHSIPVIMLTARGDVMDKVVGLEMGADDYLPKPFEPRELVARIQTVLRRSHPVTMDNKVFTSDGLSVDLLKRTASLHKQVLDISTMEFELLALLIRHPGKIMSRDDIMENLKGMDWDALNRTVDITISRLRQRLQDDPKQPRFIKTVWGKGYQFIAEVTHAAP